MSLVACRYNPLSINLRGVHLGRHFKTLVQGAIRSGVFLTASGRNRWSTATLRDAFDRWKGALVDQAKQTTRAARHRAHARVTSMEDLIAETPADDIEGLGIKLALYVYMSGVDPERQIVPSNKSCQPTRIAFVFWVVTFWLRSRA